MADPAPPTVAAAGNVPTGAARRRLRPGHVTAATGLAAVVLVVAWLLAPPMGTDLSAQVARAEFFAAHGWAPLDLRWYAGVSPHGYSLVSPPLMAWFGPRPVGAVAAVVSALALVLLLLRTGARRPLLGGLLGAAAFTGNLVSGRISFAVGVALGLLALLALVLRRAPLISPQLQAGSPAHQELPKRGALLGRLLRRAPLWGAHLLRRGAPLHVDPDQGSPPQTKAGGAGALVGALALAVLAAAASPVAGLFVGLAGAALLLTAGEAPLAPESARDRGARDRPARDRGGRDRGGPAGRTAAGVVLAVGAAVPMVVMAALFGTSGWMNISGEDTLQAVGASLAVAALVPVRPIRAGALLSTAGVLAAYLLTTPVGLNATRLAAMFTLPLVAAYAVVPGWLSDRASDRARAWLREVRPAVWLVPLLVVLAVWQPPVMVADLARAGDPDLSAEYVQPLRDELARRQPTGRVEVVPTENYWEAARLDGVSLARGWLRQADTGRNPLFFDGTLAAGTYRQWLVVSGVSHVAVPAEGVSWVGRREAELIRGGLPYLTRVWSGGGWTLYEVSGSRGLLTGPAELVEHRADAVVLDATEAGEILVRVRWSPYFTVASAGGGGAGGACLARAGEWTEVRVPEPGRYTLTSALAGTGPRCPASGNAPS